MSANSEVPTVLVVGIGEVGRYLLEFLAREDAEVDIVVGDVDLPSLQGKVDNAVFGAALHHRDPRVRAVEVDLVAIGRPAELLNDVRPDVVVNCSVLQTWT